MGLFTEPLTADLFLHSNDPNAFCLLHGNSFRKFNASHAATRSAPVTRAVFLSRTLLMISTHANHIAVINNDLLSALSWTAIPVEAHAFAAAWPSVTPDLLFHSRLVLVIRSEMKKRSLFSPTDSHLAGFLAFPTLFLRSGIS